MSEYFWKHLPEIICTNCGLPMKEHKDVVEESIQTVLTRHISDPDVIRGVKTPALTRFHKFYCADGKEFNEQT